MKFSLPPNLVKRSLASHSWLGLCLGIVMYLICLSGTIAVFYEEIERWEQPRSEEYAAMNPQVLETAFNNFMTDGREVTEHMYIVFPLDSIPRVKLASDLEALYLNSDGSFGEEAFDEYSALVTGLHLNLHLPINIGLVIVSAAGALLCGLIISGFLSHPSIIKDAFKLRLNSSKRIGQVDIHNRLSVWGSPFYLMIALTGTYYGFILIMVAVLAKSEGSTSEILLDQVFPAEPQLVNQLGHLQIAEALQRISELSPEGIPLFMTVHDAPTENRFMEFYVQQPGRLIYSENYRFDKDANYLGKAGYSDGETSAQILYSVYRIHFGHFAGIITKIIYIFLGLAMTWVSVSGINIWLEKRKHKDRLNSLWPALVWGAPLAFTVSAITQVIFHIPSISVFWSILVLSTFVSMFEKTEQVIKYRLQLACGVGLIVLLLAYIAVYKTFAFAPAAIWGNMILLGIAVCMFYMSLKNRETAKFTNLPGTRKET